MHGAGKNFDPNYKFYTGERSAWNKGRRAETPDEIFVKGRKKSWRIREYLATERGNRCEECGQLPMWNGKSLTLQVDHIDGDNMNQERTNLRLLCPNCHTQTPNFGAKNRKTWPGKRDVISVR